MQYRTPKGRRQWRAGLRFVRLEFAVHNEEANFAEQHYDVFSRGLSTICQVSNGYSTVKLYVQHTSRWVSRGTANV